MLGLGSMVRGGCSVAYETTLYGWPVARSWMVAHGALRDPSGPDVYELRFWQEYDALGLGPPGRAIRSVGVLHCEADGRPLQYRLVAGGVPALDVAFADGEALVWAYDGTSLEVPCEGADFLLAANMPA